MDGVWSAKIASPHAFPKPAANEARKKPGRLKLAIGNAGGIRGRGGEGGRGKCCGKRGEAEKETD
jgi:hypothetical protein